MPEKSQSIAVNGYDAATLTAIAYGTLEQLKWNIKYAGENIIVAYTPKSFNRWDMEITVQATDNQLAVNSKSIHGEAFDMMGRNQKNINQFAAAFENVKPTADEASIQIWNEKIAALQQDTIKAAGEEIKQAEEIDKVMNLSSGNLYVTYSIIAINIIVFVLMVLNGVDIMRPTVADIIKWGGNHYDYTPAGEWWRLITSMFEHIGIFHVLLNMYALYSLSTYLEPMLGKVRFTAGYFATGIAAGLASLWWHKETGTVSAGASGAIFGMYGIMLALLLTNLIPKAVRQGLLQSIVLFVAYNIFYGLRPGSGIDNSAHIGGFLSGLVVGYLFYFSLGKKESGKKGNIFSAAVLLVAALGAYLMVGSAVDSDNAKFNKVLIDFSDIEEKALKVYRDSTLTDKQAEDMLRNVSIGEWKKAVSLFNMINEDKLTGAAKHKYVLFKEYSQLRLESTQLQLKRINENSENYDVELNKIGDRIQVIIKELNPTGD
jgi:rhomboid protease GluP